MLAFQNNYAEELSLPVLYIKDSKTSKDVPVCGLAGNDNTFIQAVAVQKAPLQFQQVSSGDLINSQGYSKAVVSLRFSLPTSSADVRFIREDVSGVISVSPIKTISATSVQDGDYYIGEEAVFDILGAEKVGVLIVSGTVEQIYLAAV
jgi:hypothetical protein